MSQPTKRKTPEFDIIEPIGKRVVVRKDDNKRITKSGIVLPDTHEIPVITGAHEQKRGPTRRLV